MVGVAYLVTRQRAYTRDICIVHSDTVLKNARESQFLDKVPHYRTLALPVYTYNLWYHDYIFYVYDWRDCALVPVSFVDFRPLVAG